MLYSKLMTINNLKPFDPTRVPTLKELRGQVKKLEDFLRYKEPEEVWVQKANLLRQELGLEQDIDADRCRQATRIGMDLGRLIGTIAYNGDQRIQFLKGLIYQLGREVGRSKT